MKNGAEYVLRFGNLTNVAGSDKDKEEKAADKEASPAAGKDKKGDKSDVHRYLFVMARFNKDAVKQPDLAKLPDLPAGTEAKPDAGVKEGAADAKKDDADKRAKSDEQIG